MARPCWGQGSHVLHSGGSWSGWLALGLSPTPPPFPLQPLPASMCVLSHFSCVRLFVTPRTVACEAPLRELLGFSRQGYLSGLPLPPPRGLPPPHALKLHRLQLPHWRAGPLPPVPPGKPWPNRDCYPLCLPQERIMMKNTNHKILTKISKNALPILAHHLLNSGSSHLPRSYETSTKHLVEFSKY